MTKVTVVIPVYNVEGYIGKCLESVLEQSLSEFDVICVDDCGTDGSIEIVKRYMRRDNRIRLISNDRNMGLSSTRNKGLIEAEGKYVYFLDSDDYIEPTLLEIAYKKAEEYGADIVYFDTKVIEQDYSKGVNGYDSPKYVDREEAMDGRTFFSESIKKDAWDTCVWRQFYRNDFLKSNGLKFADGIEHEDWLFSFLATMSSKCSIYLPIQLHNYVRRSGSITDKLTWHRIRSLMYTYYQMMGYWNSMEENKEIDPAIRKHIAILKTFLVESYRNFPFFEEKFSGKEEFLFNECIPQLYGGYYYYKLPKNQMIEILSTKRMAIYGIKGSEKYLYHMLENLGVKAESFLVDDKNKFAEEYYGVPINNYYEYKHDFMEEGLVLVVNRDDAANIKNILESEKYRNVLIVEHGLDMSRGLKL